MAILKALNQKGHYHDSDARNIVIKYILNPFKACSGYYGGVYVDPEDIAGSMNNIAIRFNKNTGVQLRHYVLAFTPQEMDDIDIVYDIACNIARFIGREYQVVFAIHENTTNLHIHFVFNAISYIDGHRYYGKRKEYYDLINYLTELLHYNYGLILQTVSSKSAIDIQ